MAGSVLKGDCIEGLVAPSLVLDIVLSMPSNQAVY